MDFMRDYAQDTELVKQFFKDYTHVGEDDLVEPKYKERLTQIANREAQHVFVEISDLEHFNQDLANQVMRNTWRYTKIFYEALDEILPSYKTKNAEAKDPMDVFIEQRLFVAERNQRGGSGQASAPGPSQSNPSGGVINMDVDGKYPAELLRRYEVYFKPTSFAATPIRDVRAETVGKFVTVRGIVTRTSDVKPKIVIVTYTCDLCGYESFQTVDGPEYTPLFECTSAVCKANKSIGRMTSQTRGSKFVKCQEVKLQEHSDHVPTGHIPRTITVTVHGELTRSCTPGDHISVSGIFLPINPKGYRMRNHGNTADTYIEAHYITQMNKTEDDELSVEPMTNEEAALFIHGESNFLKKLSSSIAPEIFGHEKLKKALLLLLVGGVDKNTRGMKIRGNINICLMGDPGVAKSQLLAFIDRLATRSQYTTGRGSSGVGLTAAVLKDPITNELVLEGGALVLADQGICCIDEFDKMMDADRTAIHEVMEQQTVSIAKAGINTTLNARVSILAAANPAYGRINIHKSIPEQLQLPPALLSRFDLLWVIMDKADREKDKELGSHVLHIHKNPGEEPQTDHQAIDMKTMRRYISLCKTKNPIVPENLTDILIDVYLKIREKGCTKKKQSDDALFTSPRSLLAIIRLSTALARLRLSETVEQPDIEAAFDLYNDSWESVMGATSKSSMTSAGSILELIKAELEDFNSMPLDRLYEVAARELKFTDNQVESALRELQEKDVVYFDHESVTLVS